MRRPEPLLPIERASFLDGVVGPVSSLISRVLRPAWVADALHGVWLGHPLHPMAVQLPVGAFLSAGILDALPTGRRSATTLIGVGVASAVPAAAAGLADWSQGLRQQQRVGLVHASANTAALGMYASSLVQRGRGRSGRPAAYAGLALVSIGGYIGGHLSYRQASGANHAEDVPNVVPAGWQDLCAVDDLPPDGTAQRRVLDAVPLLVVRDGARVHVLADRCSHLSGPLHRGVVADGCVTCPWHGSVFSLEDGAVVHGPATAPQPAFDVRVDGGRVKVCLPGAG